MLICKEYVNFIKSTLKISHRTILINFDSNPALSIICTHAPTDNRNLTEAGSIIVQDYYDELSTTIGNLPKHNILFVVGDFNARIGYDRHITSPQLIGKHTLHQQTNENGEKLVDLCQNHSSVPDTIRIRTSKQQKMDSRKLQKRIKWK